MNEIKTIYKNCDIFHKPWDKWKVKCDYGEYENEKLSKVKEWIDRKIKEQFKRYDVIVNTYSGYFTGTVTSEINENEVWVVFDDKSRAKKEKKNITMKTTKRMEIVNKIEKIKTEKKEFDNKKNQEIKELEKQLFDRGMAE